MLEKLADLGLFMTRMESLIEYENSPKDYEFLGNFEIKQILEERKNSRLLKVKKQLLASRMYAVNSRVEPKYRFDKEEIRKWAKDTSLVDYTKLDVLKFFMYVREFSEESKKFWENLEDVSLSAEYVVNNFKRLSNEERKEPYRKLLKLVTENMYDYLGIKLINILALHSNNITKISNDFNWILSIKHKNLTETIKILEKLEKNLQKYIFNNNMLNNIPVWYYDLANIKKNMLL